MHFSREEWDSLPWYESRMYLEGLEEEARQMKGEGGSRGVEASPTSRKPIDLTSTDADLSGFKTRRAG